ncbi:LysR family transcriptional regulator [Dyella silvatica]|uniref:LysR family transcriptional regulator n=1 Tax=Dyella silvatica TaxID=2992128 RepID=UPI00225A1BBD|nr:LysR family transcriptional regulator [Dyella silvatica]
MTRPVRTFHAGGEPADNDRISLDWEDLRYFMAFAPDESLSAAARRLNVDHATVARRIESLERSLRLKLVDRRPRSYVLTDDGRRIAAAGERMQDEAFQVLRLAAGSQPGVTGEVIVSAPPALAGALIAPRLGELRERHDGLSLQLIAATTTASLSRREADIAVRLRRPDEPELVARKVATIPFALYAAADYAAHVATSSLDFIAYDASMEDSPQQAWLRMQAAGRPIVFSSNDLMIQAVAAQGGVGVAALPHFLGTQFGLVTVPMKGAPLERDVWLAVHRDVRNLPRIRAVMTFLAECLGQA